MHLFLDWGAFLRVGSGDGASSKAAVDMEGQRSNRFLQFLRNSDRIEQVSLKVDETAEMENVGKSTIRFEYSKLHLRSWRPKLKNFEDAQKQKDPGFSRWGTLTYLLFGQSFSKTAWK